MGIRFSTGPLSFSSDNINGFRRRKDSLVSSSSATMDNVVNHIFNNELYFELEEEERILSEIQNMAIKHDIIPNDSNSAESCNILLDICSRFSFVKELGFGAVCRVLLVNENETNTKYVLKELTSDDKHNPDLFKKEIHLLSTMHHPHIVQYYKSYIDTDNFYIATRYYEGGNLLQRLQGNHIWTEPMAACVIYDIISAVAYLHKYDIVHRDLKPENIVFDKPGLDANVVIIGFGDSEFVHDDQMYDEFVGTIHYLPPEITRYRHGWELKKGDMWSIGVIMYQILCGMYPFHGSSNRQILNRVKEGKFEWPQNSVMSSLSKSLMRSLIRKNVRTRVSAIDALKHDWFIKKEAGTACNAKDPFPLE